MEEKSNIEGKERKWSFADDFHQLASGGLSPFLVSPAPDSVDVSLLPSSPNLDKFGEIGYVGCTGRGETEEGVWE